MSDPREPMDGPSIDGRPAPSEGARSEIVPANRDLAEALNRRFGPIRSAVPDDDRKNASVALILRPREAEAVAPSRSDHVLVIRRSLSERDPWSGHMAFPGGRFERSDPTLIDAAVRETREETGLDLDQRGQAVGRIDTVRPMGVELPTITIWPFVFRVDPHASARVNSHEVASVHWFSVADLMAPENQGTYEPVIRGRTRSFPCVMVEGHVIWGLTYRILTQFFDAVDANF